MILEINTMGRSFNEVMEDIYDAANVYGMSSAQVDKYLIVDDYGDIVEVSTDRGDYYEEVIIAMSEDLDLTYDVSIL